MKSLFILALICTACGQGPQGTAGINGTNGTNGVTGPAGADGTVITPVQFCPNVTSSYPSTFPEVGLCVNGSIYAVYSANDGFLTLIPPGTYVSNAIGSACNFTVFPNCVVGQ